MLMVGQPELYVSIDQWIQCMLNNILLPALSSNEISSSNQDIVLSGSFLEFQTDRQTVMLK